MKHHSLGRTGLKVSEICLGTMTFGYQCDEATSRAIMDQAADGGVDFFDTADCYPVPLTLETCGRTEEIVGRWLAGKRTDFILATKCFFPMGTGPNDRGSSRKHILQAVDASLKRLNTDYVDLYQVHAFDNETPLEETLEALDQVVRSGKARYIGCSNFQAWHLGRALSVSRERRIARFDCTQPRYNVLHRDIEADLLPLCQHEGVGVIVFNPLAGGLLTGKHKAGGSPEESGRFGDKMGATATLYRARYWHQESLETIQRLKTFFDTRSKALPATAVAWVLGQPGITSAIVGASSPAQLKETLGAVERSLDADERAILDEVWYGLPRQRPGAGPVR